MTDGNDVYQVLIRAAEKGVSGRVALESIPDQPLGSVRDGNREGDETHYLFEEFGSPESMPQNEGADLYESYDNQPVVFDNEEPCSDRQL